MVTIRKFIIEENLFNNIRITAFDNKNEWLKEIDELAIDNINKGTFNIKVFEFENSEEEIETEKIKIFGSQGKKNSCAYVDKIPEGWREPIFTQEIEYFQILENIETGKYYTSEDYGIREEYNTKEECIKNESPSKYIDF